MENSLLVVIEIGRATLTFNPRIRFFNWLFGTAKVNTILLGAGGENDALQLFGSTSNVKSIEEVSKYGIIDIPVLLFCVLLWISGEEDVFSFYTSHLFSYGRRVPGQVNCIMLYV